MPKAGKSPITTRGSRSWRRDRWPGRVWEHLFASVARSYSVVMHRQISPASRGFRSSLSFSIRRRDLSVQVHPDDVAAARLVPPDLGKTEAWVIVGAELGSRVYAGLRSGIDRQQLAEATAAGRTAECLHAFEPDVGDCIFIPAGTVHALGAGLVVAEIQQASDTTYRLFDWNRVGPDGQPRALHIEQALAAIDYSAGPVTPVVPQATDRPEVQRLVACDKFVLDRWTISDVASLGGDGRMHIVTVLEGVLASILQPANSLWTQKTAGSGSLAVRQLFCRRACQRQVHRPRRSARCSMRTCHRATDGWRSVGRQRIR